jgi:hypothetical protein
MASGHANRANRPNTWLHRTRPCDVKILLANPEPSTHGTSATYAIVRKKSASGAKADLVASVSDAHLSSRTVLFDGRNAPSTR